MKHATIAGAIAAACFAFSVPSIAGADSAAPPTLSVSGSGSVSYAPDTSQLSFGVRAESPSAAAAAKSVDSRASAVIAALRKLGIPDPDIATSDYTIEYQPPQVDGSQMMVAPGGKPMMTPRPSTPPGSYVATETIDVQTSLTRAGSVLDTAVGAGADETYGISFDTSRRSSLYREALSRAVADARAQADVLAKAAGVSIAGIQSIQVGGGAEPVPMMRMASMQPGATVMGGTGTIDATVDVVFRIR